MERGVCRMCGKEGKFRECLPYMTVNPKKFCRRCLAMVEYEDYCDLTNPSGDRCLDCGGEIDEKSPFSKERCHNCWYNREFPRLN